MRSVSTRPNRTSKRHCVQTSHMLFCRVTEGELSLQNRTVRGWLVIEPMAASSNRVLSSRLSASIFDFSLRLSSG